MPNKQWLKLILTTFLVTILVDLVVLITPNIKEFFTDRMNEKILYLFKLIGAWFVFSFLFGTVIFLLQKFIHQWGKQNSHLDKLIFCLMCPFVFCIFLLTAIGLQLRFYGGVFFPANFDENFFALFGLSIILSVVGAVVLFLKIFVIKPYGNSQLLNLNQHNQNIFSIQFLIQKALPVIIGISISRQYGLVSGLIAYFGIIILYEMCQRILKPKN